MEIAELTFADLEKLNLLRLERFRKLFAQSLLSCLLQVDCDGSLLIYCFHFDVFNNLLMDLADISTCAQMVLGVDSVTLCVS